MRGVISRLATLLGAGAWGRWRRRRDLLVLMYHGVVEEPLSPFCWHQLPVSAFRRQMTWVARHYRVLPLGQALELRARGELPERACAITFDDGYRNVAETAFPVLAERRLPASVFLVTGGMESGMLLWPDRVWLAFARAAAREVDLSALGLGIRSLHGNAARAAATSAVLEALKAAPREEKDALVLELCAKLELDEPPPRGPFARMRWSDVEALEDTGLVGFGAHSVSHEILSRCDDEEVERQVRASYQSLRGRLGDVLPVFAYPNGRAQDFDARAQGAVGRAGIPWALTTVQALVGDGDDPLALPRICVGADLDFARFRLLCAGYV